MSLKIMISPQRYVQGPGALSQLGENLELFGIKKPLILASPSAWESCRVPITASLEAKDIPADFIQFGRTSSMNEILRVKEACLQGGHDCIISCGGGSAMDTGRAAAAGSVISILPFEITDKFGAEVPCIQIPTTASSDAATASSSMVYTDTGIWQTALLTRRNPAMVLVDTEIIAKAPLRSLVAGMGDALATHFEADVSRRTATPSVAGGLATRAALNLSRLTYDILTKYALQAVKEADAGIAGPALEAVVEANILLSGLGYENGGLSAAHAVASSLGDLQGIFESKPYHGELVAFGTLTQLILEEREPELLEEVFYFCTEVGLPTSFEGMGLKKTTEEQLFIVAEAASRSMMIASMPEAASVPNKQGEYYDTLRILNALKIADAYADLCSSQCQCERE